MNRTLEGKAAIVTGASRGIGATTARMLAVEGASVLLAALFASETDKIADDIRSNGGGVALRRWCERICRTGFLS